MWSGGMAADNHSNTLYLYSTFLNRVVATQKNINTSKDTSVSFASWQEGDRTVAGVGVVPFGDITYYRYITYHDMCHYLDMGLWP